VVADLLILTTTPKCRDLHCPRPNASEFLDPDSYDLWLDPGMKDVAAASELLKPYDAGPDAMLSRGQAGQQHGERRRSLLCTSGTRADSESAFHLDG